MRILAISPGWNEKPPKVSHSFEPFSSRPMSMGSTSRMSPASPMVNL